jgi:hypothetical protein
MFCALHVFAVENACATHGNLTLMNLVFRKVPVPLEDGQLQDERIRLFR